MKSYAYVHTFKCLNAWNNLNSQKQCSQAAQTHRYRMKMCGTPHSIGYPWATCIEMETRVIKLGKKIYAINKLTYHHGHLSIMCWYSSRTLNFHIMLIYLSQKVDDLIKILITLIVDIYFTLYIFSACRDARGISCVRSQYMP